MKSRGGRKREGVGKVKQPTGLEGLTRPHCVNLGLARQMVK
jgi:hypothetical protein